MTPADDKHNEFDAWIAKNWPDNPPTSLYVEYTRAGWQARDAAIAALRADLAAKDAALTKAALDFGVVLEAVTEQIAPLRADAASLRALLQRWYVSYHGVADAATNADTARALEAK